MRSYPTIGLALLAACCLQACGMAPARPPLTVQPLLRIDDARTARAAQPRGAAAATAAVARAAAADPAPAAGAMPVQPSRMEIVQLGPNEFRLQYRQSAATVATATAAAATGVAAAADVQIVNGNGVAGMGERVRRLMARHGIAVAKVVNQRRHYQRNTIIEYLPDQLQQARTMQAALDGRATLLAARALPDGIAVRLVLGRDNLQLPPRLSALSEPPMPAPQDAPAMLLAALSGVAGVAVPHFNQE